MLGAHTEKRDIIEAFHQHISWPAMRDWDKTVQQKAQGVRSQSQHANILQKKKKGERKYANEQMSQFVQKWLQSQQHNWTIIKVRRCVDGLNGMPPFPVWNESWTWQRDFGWRRQNNVWIYIEGKAVEPVLMLSFGLPGEGFWLWNPTREKVNWDYAAHNDVIIHRR